MLIMDMDTAVLKAAMRRELPQLLEEEPVKESVIKATQGLYADQQKTEDRFLMMMEELRRDREENARKWEEQNKKWEEWNRKWEEEKAEDRRKWEEQNKKWEEWNKKWEEWKAEDRRKWENWRKEWEEWKAEDRRKWEEQNKKWEEWNRKWEEEKAKDRRKWEEQNKKWEEWNKKWEEWKAEDRRKWEEQNKKWEENNKRFYEVHEEIMKMADKLDRKLSAIGARWGMQSEMAFRNALAGILEENFGVKVLNIRDYDDTGEVFGRPDQVELDIIIKNGMLIICELKSSMSKGDMYAFERKVRFYEKRHQRKADSLIVISPMVDDKAMSVARELGIRVYSDSTEVDSL